MSVFRRILQPAGWRLAAWGRRRLVPKALRRKRRGGGHPAGGAGHVIILAVTHDDGAWLTRALDSILESYVQGVRVVVATHRRERGWVEALLKHFAGNLPTRILHVANDASRAKLFRAGLESLGADVKYVAFMRGCDRWLRYGLWRLVSLGLNSEADILAGGVEHVCGARRNVSLLSSQVRDRAYGLQAAQLPSLLFDGQIFGKFFRPELAREILRHEVAADDGGFAHGGLQRVLKEARVSLFGVPVYAFEGKRPVNASNRLPLDDPTFHVRNILDTWRDGETLLNDQVWPVLISPEFYFPVPDNAKGREWMIGFLRENFGALPVPERFVRQHNGDKPHDLFVQSLAGGEYEQAYEMMKRCRFRATRRMEMPETLQRLRKDTRPDGQSLANVRKKVRQAALSGKEGRRQPAVLRKGRPFRRFVLDRMEGFGTHRSGWAGVMQHLAREAAEGAEVFVESFLERTYCWDADLEAPRRDVPWVGFAHRPPNIPEWYPEDLRRQFYHHPDFLRSLDTCLGIFALSAYHAEYLRRLLPVPVDVLYHPAEKVDQTWDPDLLDERPKVVQVGFWLRRMHGIHLLPPGNYEKIMLNKGSKESAAARAFQREAQVLQEEGHDLPALYATVRELDFLPAEEYDALLSSCVVFLDMYDASANNTVVECMVRHTPLLVRRLPPVEEYLGRDYPFFFDDYEEAAAKANDRGLILQAHDYLRAPEVQRRVSMRRFVNNFLRSPLFDAVAKA